MLLVNELFSGIGTQALALEYSNIPHKVVGTAEIEKNAINVYNVLHGNTFNYGDISKIDELNYADLWTYSFPCFTEDMLIYTDEGYKPIKSVCVGDTVLTHTKQFKKVVKFFNNGEHSIWHIDFDGYGDIKTTENHCFYVRSFKHNKLSDPIWKMCKELNKDDYLCIPSDMDTFYSLNKNSLLNLDGYLWTNAYTVYSAGYTEKVYDIEVEEDHSFIVQGVVAHNCQDISSGGKGKGVDAVDSEGNAIQTRSGLLWEVERLLERACGYIRENGQLVKDESIELSSPKFLVLENVPELVKTKKHFVNFLKWTDKLEFLGYNSSFAVLNGADFGVPQNRERVFCVSIRRDILKDTNERFEFPNIVRDNLIIPGTGQCTPNNVRLEDFVEDSVMAYKGPLMIDPKISNYLLPAYSRDIEEISRSDKPIWTCKCDSGFQDHRVGIDFAPTIRHQNSHTAVFVNNQIHKLTGLEAWRFMGIKDEDFYKVRETLGLSDNILIGLAGNAIIVPILQMLFKQINYINANGEQDISTLSTFV